MSVELDIKPSHKQRMHGSKVQRNNLSWKCWNGNVDYADYVDLFVCRRRGVVEVQAKLKSSHLFS